MITREVRLMVINMPKKLKQTGGGVKASHIKTNIMKEKALIKIESLIAVKQRDLDNVFRDLYGIVDIDTAKKVKASKERELETYEYIKECIIKNQ